MHNVRQIVEGKGGDIWAVAPDDLVIDAVREMARYRVGAMLVMRDGEMVGMFSERDYARKVILADKSSRETRVEEVMNSPVLTIDPRATAEEGLALMTQNRIRHLPVVENGKLIGLVSIGDLVNAVIGDQKRLIEHLESYVRGAV
ncbi:MAG: CBS domain-containing protein [Wenzhouxiangella sp.]|nr:CBS domain-containing protein [Wenzhouxiangella sp.]